jgi:hypothetical protein
MVKRGNLFKTSKKIYPIFNKNIASYSNKETVFKLMQNATSKIIFYV